MILFYRRLWRQAERDRREADVATRRMAALMVELLDTLGVDEHPNPVVRGQVRQLRHVAARWSS